MKIYLASDHAGFEHKSELLAHLKSEGHEVEDMGPQVFDPSDDYPDLIAPLARRVAEDKGSFGVIFGMSGQGEAMAANRIKGARAAVFYGGSIDILTLSRTHNDANILSLGSHFLTKDQAQEAVKIWLNTAFSGQARHERRIAKLDRAAE